MPVSGDQRRAIVDLLTGGLDNHEVAAEIGVSPRTVAAVKAHITMGSYGNVDSGASDAEADVEDAIGAALDWSETSSWSCDGTSSSLRRGLS